MASATNTDILVGNTQVPAPHYTALLFMMHSFVVDTLQEFMVDDNLPLEGTFKELEKHFILIASPLKDRIDSSGVLFESSYMDALLQRYELCWEHPCSKRDSYLRLYMIRKEVRNGLPSTPPDFIIIGGSGLAKIIVLLYINGSGLDSFYKKMKFRDLSNA